MLEVYNESVYDLLHATGEDLDLQLKPKSEEVHVKGLSWEDVKTGRPGRPMYDVQSLSYIQNTHACSMINLYTVQELRSLMMRSFGSDSPTSI